MAHLDDPTRRFAILRRVVDAVAQDTVADPLARLAGAAEHGVTLRERARLAPAGEAVRVQLAADGAPTRPGAFDTDRGPLTHFALCEAATREQVVAWLAGDRAAGIEHEVRETGCPGGLPGVPPGVVATLPRFVVFVRADVDTEAERHPPPPRLDAMQRCNDDAVRRGLLLAADGLQSTARGARVRRTAARLQVLDGPFAETKELVAGFWLVQAPSVADVVAWVRTYPYAQDRPEVEVRPVHD